MVMVRGGVRGVVMVRMGDGGEVRDWDSLGWTKLVESWTQVASTSSRTMLVGGKQHTPRIKVALNGWWRLATPLPVNSKPAIATGLTRAIGRVVNGSPVLRGRG